MNENKTTEQLPTETNRSRLLKYVKGIPDGEILVICQDLGIEIDNHCTGNCESCNNEH